MAHGAIEMNPLKGNCKCNSCESGHDGTGGNGYQPCASKLKRPPTVAHYPREQGQAYSKDYRAGLTSGFLIGFSCACVSAFILSLVIVAFN